MAYKSNRKRTTKLGYLNMNMSYCRFRNTRIDLEDCCGALEDLEEISVDEMVAAETMYEECERYLRAFKEYKQHYSKDYE